MQPPTPFAVFRMAFGLIPSWFRWSTIAILVLLVLSLGNWSFGQCGPQGCPVQRPVQQPWPPQQSPPTAPAYLVRIHHDTGSGGVSLGTGSVIRSVGDYTYHLTCAHLFSDGEGRTTLGTRVTGMLPAKIIRLDRANDLALLRTPRMAVRGLTYRALRRTGGLFRAMGFGSNGLFRSLRGSRIGESTARGATHPSLIFQGGVRPGDSGGPLLDHEGGLVGVLWGTARGNTYAMVGPPVERILQGIPQPPPVARPARPPPKSVPSVDHACPESNRIEALEAALDKVQAGSVKLGSEMERSEGQLNKLGRVVADVARQGEAGRASLAARLGHFASEGVKKAAIRVGSDLLLGGLGLGTPIGLAMLAGRWWFGKRNRPGGAEVPLDF